MYNFTGCFDQVYLNILPNDADRHYFGANDLINVLIILVPFIAAVVIIVSPKHQFQKLQFFFL